jgi:5-methylcytosine-specific restriction endonuclease McrA
LKESERAAFLAQVLGTHPSAELLEQVAETARGPRLKEEEYITLELAQNGRCALCGCPLTPAVGPQVDHIIPVSLRGKSVMSNYQLLCEQCNQGKKKLIGWIIGAPFFDASERVTYRMRYCVLARSAGKCQHTGCLNTARNATLVVVPIIPVAQGGRWIFDNLMTICEPHAEERERIHYEEALRKVRKTKSKDKLFANFSLLK